jgi:hypothetical protein
MKEINFTYCTIKYKAPVIFITFREGSYIDVPETKEMIKATEELTGKKPYLLLSDARVFLTITPEARKVSADKKEAPFLIANAVLINNLPLTLTANFFLTFNKPHFKFKVFNNEEKAMKWLLQYDPLKPKRDPEPKKKSLFFG